MRKRLRYLFLGRASAPRSLYAMSLNRTSAGATDVQRNRPVPAGVVIGDAAARRRRCSERPDDVRVEEDLDRSTLPVQARCSAAVSATAVRLPRPPRPLLALRAGGRRPRAGGGRRRRRDRGSARRPATERRRFSSRPLASSVTRVGRHVALVSERKMPFMPPPSVFSARSSTPVLHPGGALERREESGVLIRAVEDEPTAGGSLGNAGDLALLGAPVGLPCGCHPASVEPWKRASGRNRGGRRRSAERQLNRDDDDGGCESHRRCCLESKFQVTQRCCSCDSPVVARLQRIDYFAEANTKPHTSQPSAGNWSRESLRDALEPGSTHPSGSSSSSLCALGVLVVSATGLRSAEGRPVVDRLRRRAGQRPVFRREARSTGPTSASSAIAWAYPYGETGSNPIVARGVIYGRGRNGSLIALDAKTGKEIWIREGMQAMTARGMNYWESKDGKDRRLIFSMNDYLQEINAATGQPDLRVRQGRRRRSARRPRTATRRRSGGFSRALRDASSRT